jgi:hypothetical protein
LVLERYDGFPFQTRNKSDELEETRLRCTRKLRVEYEGCFFIPVVARIAIELGLFKEQYRGGLFIQNEDNSENVLHHLICSRVGSIEYHNREHHESIDDYKF